MGGSQPLNIEVHEITSRPKRLGSVRFEPHDVQELSDWALGQYKAHHKGESEDGLMSLQFHSCRVVDDLSEDEKVNVMWEAGFKPHKLSNGGYIWLGFCSVKKPSNAVCS